MQTQASVSQMPDATNQSVLVASLPGGFSETRYTLRCARCGAMDEGWDHDDDAPLTCPSCIPHRLADYARPPHWLQHNPQADQSWGLDRRINERSKEYLAVCHTSLSARIWRRFAGKESFLADRRQLAAEGRI